MKHICYGLNDFSDSSKEIDGFEGAKDHKQTVKQSEISVKQHQQQKPRMGDRAVFQLLRRPFRAQFTIANVLFLHHLPFLSIN
jgi:hypothetical protein